jgi:hypothetical protein
MIRQTEDEMRAISKNHDNCVIQAIKDDSKWIADLVIPNYATIRMRSARLNCRKFGNIDSLIKACDGMASKIEINI